MDTETLNEFKKMLEAQKKSIQYLKSLQPSPFVAHQLECAINRAIHTQKCINERKIIPMPKEYWCVSST